MIKQLRFMILNIYLVLGNFAFVDRTNKLNYLASIRELMELYRLLIIVPLTIIGVFLCMLSESYPAGLQAQTGNETIADMQAQELMNENISNIEAQRSANVSNITDIEAQAGTSSQNPNIATIKIVSTCKFNDASCARLLDDLFRVQPAIFRDNSLVPLGSGFVPSQFGRTIEIPIPPGGSAAEPAVGSIQYEIGQYSTQVAKDLFNIYTGYSYNCEGQIRGGESKTCTIDSVLYPR